MASTDLPAATHDSSDDDDHSAAEDAVAPAHSSSAGQGGEQAAAKKKKKKKSKAKKIADKVRAAVGGERDVPDEILDRVMEEVKKLPEGTDGADASAEEVKRALQAMKLMDFLDGKKALDMSGGSNKKDLGEFKFWKTQPVPQFQDPNTAVVEGPIDAVKNKEEFRQTPYPLPNGFDWCTVDVTNAAETKEVYDLLSLNYVEDDDATMRFDYSAEFLDWALKPPGWIPSWHIGVRVKTTKKLVAFISGIPVHLRVRSNDFRSVEINFLCVHKKLRSKRLAPVLIKEVTRRCNLEGIFQAIYTAGVTLPVPVAVSRYYHRNLNPPKLIDIGFAVLPRHQTMARYTKHMAVPPEPTLPGWREMREDDVEQVGKLLRRYLERFEVAPIYTDEDIRYWLLSGRGEGEAGANGRREKQVVWAYVVEDPETHKITDCISFYSLPSTVIGHAKYPTLHAAYTFYYATDKAFPPADASAESSSSATTDIVRTRDQRDAIAERLKLLVEDLLSVAKKADFDVMNSLTTLDSNMFLQHHKFGMGNGFLNYYLYNYRAEKISGGFPDDRTGSSGVGVVML